jgi:hypothetical protein
MASGTTSRERFSDFCVFPLLARNSLRSSRLAALASSAAAACCLPGCGDAAAAGRSQAAARGVDVGAVPTGGGQRCRTAGGRATPAGAC